MTTTMMMMTTTTTTTTTGRSAAMGRKTAERMTTMDGARSRQRHATTAAVTRRGFAVRTHAGGVSKKSLDEGYNCVMREDGVLIAEGDIPTGTYEVSAWWAGVRNDGQGNAPRCDSERQRGCEVRCELTAEGELVCEGIESGTYSVVNVKDLDEVCKVSMDGDSIDCDSVETPALNSDTGDLNLKDKTQHGMRLGG